MPKQQNSNVYTALLCFNKRCGAIGKESKNSFFNSPYASLPDILAVIVPHLNECGLIITHQMTTSDEAYYMTTSVIHAQSETKIESSYRLMIKGKQDNHSWGSAITYAKRYAISALLNLTIGADMADDDGEAAMMQEKQPQQQQRQQPQQQQRQQRQQRQYQDPNDALWNNRRR